MLKLDPIAYALALVASLAAVVVAWRLSPGAGAAAVTGLASTIVMGVLGKKDGASHLEERQRKVLALLDELDQELAQGGYNLDANRRVRALLQEPPT